MKKLLSILLCFVVIGGVFVGCSSKQNSSASVPASTPATGAFSEDRKVTEEDKRIFEQAVTPDGTKTYELLTVATQIVAGTNYRFTVNITEDGKQYAAHVFILKPLEGPATFVSEEKI